MCWVARRGVVEGRGVMAIGPAGGAAGAAAGPAAELAEDADLVWS